MQSIMLSAPWRKLLLIAHVAATVSVLGTENILAKLAFSSRAQIAAWAVEKALIAPSQDR